MSLFSTFRTAADSRRLKTSSRTRTNRMRRRRWQLESLESRTLLAYVFTYNGVNGPQTVDESGGSDTLTIVNNGFGLLEWSANGGAFSTQWGALPADTLNASPLTSVTVNLAADNSAIVLGNATSSASGNQAKFNLNAAPGNMSDTLSINDAASPLGPGTYTVDGVNGVITGPLADINIQEGANAFGGGTTLIGGNAANTFDVMSTYSFGGIPEPLTVTGGSGTNIVNVGNDPGTPASSALSGIVSLVTVSDPTGSATLNLLDAGDTTSGEATIDTGTVTGFGFGSGGSVAYTGGLVGAVTSLVVDGGTNGASGINYFVDGTSASTTLNTGPNADTVFVTATGTGALLTIHGNSGLDTVNIGDLGSVLGILGDITVDNVFDFTAINVDASADPGDHNATLSGFDPSTLTGVAPATITYLTDDASTLTIDTNAAGSQVLNVDFSGGNPIPADGTPGLVFNGGGTSGSFVGNHILNLFGTLPSGAFTSETHNANDQTVFPQNGQYGSIDFVDSTATGTSLDYTGLQPINDTTPAVNYTFNDFGNPDQSFSATNGPTVMGFDTVQFTNTPTPPTPLNFETTTVANKTNIVFNTTTAAGITGTVNIPTPSTGLATMTFNTPTGGDNAVSFVNTPPGVVTSLFGGSDEDATNVAGAGIAGVPTTTSLFLNGGAGQNTLDYNADGETPTVTPDGMGGVFISIPGFGRVDATNYQIINITGTTPLVITPGPPTTINSVEGFNLTDAIVGTFSVVLPFTPPPNLPASDFTATINWGDGSPTTPQAGTITQDASNPSVYYITGTHTFPTDGTFTVTNTVAFTGGDGFRHGGWQYGHVHSPPGRLDRGHTGHGERDPGPARRLGFPDHRDRGNRHRRGPDRHVHRCRRCQSGRQLFGDRCHHRSQRFLAPGSGHYHHPERQRSAVHRQRPGHHAA